MSKKDFNIKNGVLKKYNGTDTEVTIPDGVIAIGNSAFKLRDDITKITIPNTVKKIDRWAVEGCLNLLSIDIPDSVTEIAERSFMNCGLQTVVIPGSIKTISKYAFSELTIDSIIIREGVETIDHGAFYESGVKDLYIPKSVCKICGDMFDLQSGMSLHKGLTVHVEKDSYAEKYLKEKYSNIDIVFDYPN